MGDIPIFWGDIHWQPKLTKVLKNIDPSIMNLLGNRLEEVLGIDIETFVSTSNDEKWTVSFHGRKNGTSIHLILYFHDPKTETVGASWLDISQPTIEIVDFIVHPKGQGVGSKTIGALLDFISETNYGFDIIMLRAQDERAARFWRKIGFSSITDSNSYSLSMTYPLVLNNKEKSLSVKLTYIDSINMKTKIIDSYNFRGSKE